MVAVLRSVRPVGMPMFPLGSIDHPIVDSDIDSERAIGSILRVRPDCPDYILRAQRLLTVKYYSFDGRCHQGQIVIHEQRALDILIVFNRILALGFPLVQVIPISEFGWSDLRSMSAPSRYRGIRGNCSGFNHREIDGTERISPHNRGAVDFNPYHNPSIENGEVLPFGAVYNPLRPGTLVAGDPIVTLMKELGWEWGGAWNSLKDYQHFQKPVRRLLPPAPPEVS
jgi:peptidoglycan LD-endopeptidase CwlK